MSNAVLEFINQIMNYKIGPIPVVFIIGVLVAVLYLIWKRQGKEETFDKLDTAKEIRKYLREYLSFNKDNSGYWLKSGVTNIGYVIESARISWPKNLKTYKEKIETTTTQGKLKKALEPKPVKPEELEKAYVLKVASSNVIRRYLQKSLNKISIELGLRYLIVEEKLLTFSEVNASLDPYAVARYHFNTWIYSNKALDEVDNIAIGLKHQLVIDSLVNEVPKLTYLELKQSKDMEQLNAIAKIKNKRQEKMLEEISKGDV